MTALGFALGLGLFFGVGGLVGACVGLAVARAVVRRVMESRARPNDDDRIRVTRVASEPRGGR